MTTAPWLADSGWTRLNELATSQTSNIDKHSIEGQTPVRLCNYVDVYKNDRITADLSFMAATATADQVQAFRIQRGDTIITKDSETADDIGVPAFVDYVADDLVCGYHLSIVRPREGRAHPRFLYWAMSAQPTTEQWAQLASGVTRVGLKAGDIAKVRLPHWSLARQRLIAEYLDHETAQIDALIDKQERLIVSLRERRRSQVATAIYASNGAGTGRLKHAVVGLRQGWSPQCNSWPADGVAMWGILKAGAANGGRFRPEENKELPADETPRPETVVRAGEVLVSRANTRDLVGSAAVVEGHYPRLMLCDKLYAVTLDPHLADPAYVSLTLGTRRWRDLIELEATGVSHSMQNISQADILNLPFNPPALAEQCQLVKDLRAKTERIDELIEKALHLIALSRERRAALITAAVTGRIDVRGAA